MNFLHILYCEVEADSRSLARLAAIVYELFSIEAGTLLSYCGDANSRLVSSAADASVVMLVSDYFDSSDSSFRGYCMLDSSTA